jgi:outer membrane protein
MNVKYLAFILWVIASAVQAEESVLEKYVNQALQNNLALQQQQFSLEKSLAALKEARGLFLPSIGINARYTRAGGGREIEFPVGDLFNPIYSTLNQLIQQQVFPENLRNEVIPFLREKEQETKISAVQPIFQPQILYNYKIKSTLVEIEQNNKHIYIRQVVSEVKSAYLKYLLTIQINKLLLQTRQLLDENFRVSRKLFENNKVTKEVVYRAEAELSELDQQIAQAEKSKELAKSYFNFLLNRSLDEDIVESEEDLPIQKEEAELPAALQLAIQQREELKILQLAVKASDQGIKLNQSAYLPSVFAALDYGYQGEEYRFTSSDDFWMASAVLRWNLFNGFQDQARVQQAKIDKKRQQVKYAELENQIKLQVQEIFNNVVVSRKTIKSAEDRLISARKSFEIIDRKYREGILPYIVYLDARSNLTRSEINSIITRYEYYIGLVELERVLAAYPIAQK